MVVVGVVVVVVEVYPSCDFVSVCLYDPQAVCDHRWEGEDTELYPKAPLPKEHPLGYPSVLSWVLDRNGKPCHQISLEMNGRDPSWASRSIDWPATLKRGEIRQTFSSPTPQFSLSPGLL